MNQDLNILQLVLQAVHNKVPESWISASPPVLALYIHQLVPPLGRLIHHKLVQRQLALQGKRMARFR